ncbi:MAG: hypothetical protein WBP81_11850 [Solirubrobacteraceae bacterium]
MESSDPESRDALRRLEERLDRASDAAERQIVEAAQSAARAAGTAADGLKPPPAGWQVPEEDDRPARSELDLLGQVFQSLRELIPPELQRRLVEALRELLLAVRALIDWYVDRLDRREAEPTEVQDIPIL